MEDMWINYENEETQTKIELADSIFDGLVSEAVSLLIRNEAKKLA